MKEPRPRQREALRIKALKLSIELGHQIAHRWDYLANDTLDDIRIILKKLI